MGFTISSIITAVGRQSDQSEKSFSAYNYVLVVFVWMQIMQINRDII
jgi:hypothetical protein